MSSTRRHRWIVAAVLACSLFETMAVTAQKNAAPEVLLQSAIQKEMVDGDLQAAIELYKKIVDTRGAGRNVTASALLHMGQAYEKLGSGEARKAYERIARDFADQKEVAADARKRLAVLGGTASPALTARRVDVGLRSGHMPRSISADGHWMTFTDWSVGDIAIRDMSTGQTKRLRAKAKAWEEEPFISADYPVLSPNLRQVAYHWFDVSFPFSLRVMANEPGAKPRVLVHNPEFPYLFPVAWSPDGKAILALMGKSDYTTQLAWVSATDGSVRLLKSLEWRQPNDPSLSPDGRYIAYSALVRADSKERHIYILAADGSSETELVKTEGVNGAPAWMPDGRHIVFSSNRSGSFGLWSIAVRDGKALGAASLVKADTGEISPIGITRTGSYYYLHRRGGSDVFVADLKGGRVQGATRVSEKFVGSNQGAAWSPDGKFTAFKRQRAGTGIRDLVVQSLETGEEKIYPHNLMIPAVQRPMWFHDGKAIVLGMMDNQQRTSFQLLDLKTAQWKEIVQAQSLRVALSPDDKTLYALDGFGADSLHAGPEDFLGSVVVAIDLATGQRRPVVGVPDSVADLALSPNGHTLALVTKGVSGNKQRLLVVGTDYRPDVIDAIKSEERALLHLAPGQPAELRAFGTMLAAQDPLPKMMARFPGYRELYALQNGEERFGDTTTLNAMLAFTKDSREVLFGLTSAKKPGGVQIMRIPVEGGKPDFTGLVTHGHLHDIDLSPDGSRIAFSDGTATVTELWTLDNLLPVLKAAK